MKANLSSNPELIPMLMEGLRSQIVSVTFKKKDGTIREMRATLNPFLIPAEDAPKGKSGVTEDEEEPSFVRVYDTEAKGWRTVLFDAVTEFGEVALA